MPGRTKNASYHHSPHIAIPPDLPNVLKEYTKAVLRNQPDDVLGWSARYFGNLSENNGVLDTPMSEELDSAELIRPDTALLEEKGQTVTLSGLKTINHTFKDVRSIPFTKLLDRWTQGGFSKLQLTELVTVCEFYSGEVPRSLFMAVACSSMTSSLSDAMVLTMEVLGDENEQKLPFGTFEEVYRYVAGLDEDISKEIVERALSHLKRQSEQQDGCIHLKDLNSSSCPPLS